MFLCLFFIIIYVAVKMHFVVSFFIYKHVLAYVQYQGQSNLNHFSLNQF